MCFCKVFFNDLKPLLHTIFNVRVVVLVCIHFLCNQVAFSFVMIQTDAHIQAVQECCCATTTGSHLVCWFRAGLEHCLAVM